ncbi:MAG: conjugal transfer protein TraF, partial [Sphingopyxis sp.]|nr:conjugal transfer protein TraF [Sphingopyxis sp.]
MRRFLDDRKTGIAVPFALGLAVTAVALACASRISAQTITREQAARAAIHPVASVAELRTWLARVPATRDFPPDFDEMLRGQAPLYALEMSTAPGCAPCADLWSKLLTFRARYGWQVRTISVNEAMLRSGRLGLPWVGNPVVWARPNNDPNRMVPIAIGTDHA